MRSHEHSFEDGELEEDSRRIVAISPDKEFFESYDAIDLVQIPSFLMVKDKTIFADGWLIRIALYQSFLDFIQKILTAWWNSSDQETKNQSFAFMHAVEAEVSKFANHIEEPWPPQW